MASERLFNSSRHHLLACVLLVAGSYKAAKPHKVRVCQAFYIIMQIIDNPNAIAMASDRHVNEILRLARSSMSQHNDVSPTAAAAVLILPLSQSNHSPTPRTTFLA